MSPAARTRRAQQQALEQLCRDQDWRQERDEADKPQPEPEEPEPIHTFH